MSKIKHLIWLDLEMTGLDIYNCHIIEIAAIITDSELNVVAESDAIAIYQPEEVLAKMDTWCTKTHGESGLTARVRASHISLEEAEKMILNFIKPHVNKHASPLCGNSVWQDRKFLAKYMPELEDYFHYRLLDVSSFKIAASMWKPELVEAFQKENTHLALDDIKESIDEMKYYRQKLLNL
ncbi:oligoribonuclease [Fangia hongkongensis]|uniref:oligoribonuclease n=1 Tax=Fangia hongkongensis TaxID=270495 RepID=UPI000380DDB6|nr:oligoribonuclease [Fangia hongkongensis]MBK2125071.1 oligoribonuclease [Fangia hongkongensis]